MGVFGDDLLRKAADGRALIETRLPVLLVLFGLIWALVVVLVHGLNSDHTSWTNWIKPDGFLASVGMPGYAVDDGQFGTRSMNTGNPSRPLDGTNSIAENAQILAEYVEAVRVNTGAERIDLVAHSLGGLISRYYVQNLMPLVQIPGLADVPVANQLFMAGTPNGGAMAPATSNGMARRRFISRSASVPPVPALPAARAEPARRLPASGNRRRDWWSGGLGG